MQTVSAVTSAEEEQGKELVVTAHVFLFLFRGSMLKDMFRKEEKSYDAGDRNRSLKSKVLREARGDGTLTSLPQG